MVAETAVLVEGEDEESLVPVGGVSYGLVNALDEVLTKSDWGGRMEGLVVAAFRVNICELGQGSSLCVGIEIIKRLDVSILCAGRLGPAVEGGVGVKTKIRAGRGVLVVYPGDVLFRELLEDGTLREAIDVEGVVIGAVAV